MSVIQLPTDITALGLSDDEQLILSKLAERMMKARQYLWLHDAYYEGTQVVQSLGISIPPELSRLHTALGWPRLAVDVLDERLDVQGFRYPSSTDADTDLWDIWQANNLDQESELAHLDALVFGRSYVMVGSGNCGPGGPCPPLITVESPLNMAVDWDARSRTIVAALQAYEFDGDARAALYLPGVTIHMVEVEEHAPWEVYERDEHNLHFAPVVQLANRQRVANRYGASEITPEIMSVTDAACRTMLGMEVSREFFSTPQRYILGATEESFQAPDGSPKTAWETYIGRVLALERDEEGNVPEVGQFAPGDPSTLTRMLDQYARVMGSIASLPPEFLGQQNENPTSAEAIRMSTDRLVRKARRKQVAFEQGWEDVMRLALLIQTGTVPDDAHRLETIWADPGIPLDMSNALHLQQDAGFVPAESDVVLEKLGYSPNDIERLKADRKRQQAKDTAQAILEAARGNGNQDAGSNAGPGTAPGSANSANGANGQGAS